MNISVSVNGGINADASVKQKSYSVKAVGIGTFSATMKKIKTIIKRFINALYTSSGMINSPLSPITVKYESVYGVTDTSFSDIVYITKTSGPGNVSGTLSKNAVDGVAVFNDIVFDTVGTYILKISAGIADDVSISIDATPEKAIVNGLVQETLGRNSGLTIYSNADDNKYYAPDGKEGSQKRQIQPGRGYSFTGIETITFPQASITSIVNQDNNDLSQYLSGNVLTPPAGGIFKIVVNGTDIYNCDESKGTVSYDSSGNGNHATITLNGTAESLFHITSNAHESVQNDIGHWYSGNSVGVGAMTPIDISGDGTKDVLGNTVPSIYSGSVRYDVQIKKSNCGNFDGIITLEHPDLLGVSILSRRGTGVPSISGNTINVTPGTLEELVLSDGSKYQFSEGAGLIVHDIVNSNDLSINLNGSPELSQWSYSDTQKPHNEINGHTKVSYFPRLTDNFSGFYNKDASLTLGNSNSDGFTIAIKLINNATSNYRYFNWTNNNSNSFGIKADTTTFKPFTLFGGLSKIWNVTLQNGKPYSLMYVYDSATGYCKLYVNGVYRTQLSLGLGIKAKIDGVACSYATYTFKGYLWDFRGWDHKLSSSDISAYHNGVVSDVPDRWYNDFENGIEYITGYSPEWIRTGEKYYTKYLPAKDASTDILGGELLFKSNSNSIIKTENKYDRNHADAPALVASGVPQYEDIDYDTITLDKSRFYDLTGDRITDILAYNDFPEPIVGSAGQFDGVITLSHPNLSGITIQSYKGTATPSISGNTINVTAGILTELILSDGSKYVFSEESGTTLYDLSKINNLTVNLNGSASGSQWSSGGNKDYHHNLKYGYKDYGDGVKVPGDPNNAGYDVNGNLIDNQAQVSKYNNIVNYLNQ